MVLFPSDAASTGPKRVGAPLRVSSHRPTRLCKGSLAMLGPCVAVRTHLPPFPTRSLRRYIHPHAFLVVVLCSHVMLTNLHFLPWKVSWGQNCGKHCCSSRCQSTHLRWLGWTQEHKNHRENAIVYPGSGRSVPYVQQLMILILKSTQNQGVTTECRDRFGRGLARW